MIILKLALNLKSIVKSQEKRNRIYWKNYFT